MTETEISFDPELKATKHEMPVYNKQLITDHQLDPITNQPISIPRLSHEHDPNFERNLLKAPTPSDK